MRGDSFLGGVALAKPGDGHPDWRCFADEVVIDFPSVAPAVDRMRRGFLADESAAALSTAVQLSWREARDGAVLPLELPVRCTCHGCGGRGETWAERCVRCDGSGTELRRHRLRVAVPAGVTDGACFRFSVTPRYNLPTRVELRISVE